jgi:filamentous hemagglutinin family protein
MAAGLSKLIIAAPALVIFGVIASGSTDAQVTTDGTAGPRVHLAGPEFTIGADLGTQAAHNLFHSFEHFSLATGERATFTGPDDVRNIISRVTGGERSDIDGTIRSTIAGADFYFINPAGVLFGPNASLDVQGSFHISTADELRFTDGAKFSAVDTAASTFTVATPEAFGFLDDGPEAISVDRSTLTVTPGEALSLVGGDIDLSGARLTAPAGAINLLARRDGGTARINGGVAATSEGGAITLRNESRVEVTGNGSGSIWIQGGRIIADGSVISANNDGDLDSEGGVTITATDLQIRDGMEISSGTSGRGDTGNVTVTATDLQIDGGAIASVSIGQGDAGAVTITAADLEIRDGPIQSFSGGPGDAGAVVVQADQLTIDGAGAEIASEANASNAGAVKVAAADLQIRDGGVIRSLSVDRGDAGVVTVEADQLTIDGAGAGITSLANAGRGGTVSVTTADLQIRDGGFIAGRGDAGTITVIAADVEIGHGGAVISDTRNQGDAPALTVEADRLTIDGAGADESTGIFSGTFDPATGDAGRITVTATDLQIRDGGEIRSSTFGQGNAGVVTVEADRLTIDGDGANKFTGIASQTNQPDTGDAGTVTVTAADLRIRDGGAVSSSTVGRGNAGVVTVEADRLMIDGAGAEEFTGIASRAGPGTGNAGMITIAASDVQIRNHGVVTTSTGGEGDGGELIVDASRLIIDGAGAEEFTGITSQVNRAAAGGAGRVTVTATDLQIRDGAEISSGTSGRGDAGEVAVEADRLTIDGAGVIFATGIATQANEPDTGDAGRITVTATDLQIRDGGTVSSGTFGRGDGGPVTVEADRLTIDGAGAFVFAGAGLIRSTGISSDSTPLPEVIDPGDAGPVTVAATDLQIRGSGATISSRTTGGGDGGDVVVVARDRLELDHARISAASTAPSAGGAAGDVMIRNATTIELRHGASIGTEARSGVGGSISIGAIDLIDLSDSRITTSVLGTGGGTSGDAGNIDIDPRFLILDNSRIQANAALRNGGNITIRVGELVRSPDSGIEASGGAAGVPGTIAISAPEADLSGGLVVLEGALVDTAPLRARCGARRDIGASSFTGVGRGGLPASPDASLSSAYLGVPAGETALRAGFEPTGQGSLGSGSSDLAPPCRPWK